MSNGSQKKQSKLTLSKETVRRLSPVSDEELAGVAGGDVSGTTGYGMCRKYATIYCSVGGGRGICM
jgi:hypothetical protein